MKFKSLLTGLTAVMLTGWIGLCSATANPPERIAAPPVEFVGTDPPPPTLAITNNNLTYKSLIDLSPTGTDVAADSGLMWACYPPTGIEATQCGQHYIFTGPAGNYTVTLTCITADWTAKKLKITQASLSVTIGTPVPPKPPDPPQPTDPFSQAVQAAYTADATPNKAQLVADLGNLYAAWPAQAFADPTLTTTDKLLANWLVARRAIVKDTELKSVRDVIDKELIALFGTSTQPFDAALKAKAVPVYQKITTALKGVR